MAEESITAAQMRAIERASIDAGLVSGLTLMERAGQAVVAEIDARWPSAVQSQPAARALVLCGPGNNGGDGLVIARLLHLAGWHVSVFLYGCVEKLPPDARRNYNRWSALAPHETFALSSPAVTAVAVAHFAKQIHHDGRPLFVIDALFGIGLTRPLAGLTPILSALEQPRVAQRYHISIDVPSGLSESGPLLASGARVFCADLTVTFHRRKRALDHGAEFCGTVVVADIGL